MDYVEKALGIRLDFTAETLPILDHYLREARESVGTRTEAADLLVAVAGCYLGELVRQAHGFTWHADDPDPMQWSLRSAGNQLSVFPVAIAHVALHGVRAERRLQLFDLGTADRNELQQRLDALPPVDEDQYVAPSTRMEVLELAWDIVKARHQASHAPTSQRD